MKKMNKKGFTVVELVIVIAVIAVLAAVLIPTFAGILHKADVSNDTQLVKNLNTALAADTTKNYTMTDALDAAKEFGYDIEKINASATDNEILWDSANGVFCYFNDGAIEYIPNFESKVEVKEYQYWVISDVIDEKYSTYYTGVTLTGEVAINKGFDAGVTDTSAAVITYTNAGAAQTVSIRMNGGKLVVDAANDNVNKFGEAEFVDIKAVANESFHEYGKTQFTKIEKGNYVVESTGYTNAIVDASTVAGAVTISTERAIGGSKIPEYKISEIVANDPEANVDDIIANIQAGATKFAGGEGTEANPYLIENAEQLMNITEYYEEGYKYFKVKDGVKVIDCAAIPNKCISLNGSFDGNNAKFVNLAYQLFNLVGYQNKEDAITIANIDATFNSVDGGALIRSLINGGETTFENVKIHGYLEGSSNMGCFYKYGTAQYGTGASYTVNFVNSQADATLVDISANNIGGMIGHPFCGSGNTVTINMDENSGFFGVQYNTNGKGNTLAAITNVPVIMNGENYDFNNSAVTVNKIAIVNAEKAEDGAWTVAQQSAATSITVSITAQYTDYEADGVTVKPNSNGLTAVLGSVTLTDLEAITKVFDKVDSVEFVNGYLNGEVGYSLEDGVLKAYVGDRNVLEGNVRLQVAQYDANGSVLATGSVALGVITK